MKRLEDGNLPWGGLIKYDIDIWEFWLGFRSSTFQERIWKYVELTLSMKQLLKYVQFDTPDLQAESFLASVLVKELH